MLLPMDLYSSSARGIELRQQLSQAETDAKFAATEHARAAASLQARLAEALADGRHFLLGDRYSAADLIVAAPFGFFRDSIPADPKVRAWIERCLARPATAWANDEDARAMAA